MTRYLFNVEVRKTKTSVDISLFKKNLQIPLFLLEYIKAVNKCERYTIAKVLNPKAKTVSYEIISCYYCSGKGSESFASIKRSRNGKIKIVRNINNVKSLKNEFKREIKALMSLLSTFKSKKIGNLRTYSTNSQKIITLLNKMYDNLHKTH